MAKEREQNYFSLRPCPKRRRRLNPKSLVKLANEEEDLIEKVPDLKWFKSTSGESFQIIILSYQKCSEEKFNWMMSLLEKNMSDLYDSCGLGWHYDTKKEEMSGKESRYVIAIRSDNKQPVAFSHFRFDMDNGYNVLYCYELQVEKSARKIGLAKHIMHVLDSLCSCFNMVKVVLTVFNVNENAFNFYHSQGFDLDESSPQNYSIESSYSILCKTNKT